MLCSCSSRAIAGGSFAPSGRCCSASLGAFLRYVNDSGSLSVAPGMVHTPAAPLSFNLASAAICGWRFDRPGRGSLGTTQGRRNGQSEHARRYGPSRITDRRPVATADTPRSLRRRRAVRRRGWMALHVLTVALSGRCSEAALGLSDHLRPRSTANRHGRTTSQGTVARRPRG